MMLMSLCQTPDELKGLGLLSNASYWMPSISPVMDIERRHYDGVKFMSGRPQLAILSPLTVSFDK